MGRGPALALALFLVGLPSPGRAQVEDEPIWPLAAIGLVGFVGGWALAPVVTAVATPSNVGGGVTAAIPLVGPFVALAQGDAPGPPRSMLVLAGTLQACGAVLALVGLFVRRPRPPPLAISLSPEGGSLRFRGSF